MHAISCRACGAALPDGARFCPSCGAAVGGTPATAVIPPPPDETGRAPMTVSAAERHLFGVTPPAALVFLGVASLAVGVALLALGNELPGILVAVAGALLLLLFVATMRRRSESRLARAAASTADRARDRARYFAGAVTTLSGARRELARRRAQVAQLADERRRLLLDLGAAAYADDAAEAARIQSAIQDVDARIEANRSEMEAIAAQARERVRREKLQVQPTEVAQVGQATNGAPPAAP